MYLTTLVLSLCAIALPTALTQNYDNNGLITNVTIFTPPRNYTDPRTLYARTVLLEDNTLLLTWENYLPNNDSFPYMPIYQSLDLGATWTERSRVYDQVNGWGLRYQPFLYELPQAVGNWSAGTVLLAANSIPKDLSQTQIDLYASMDKGYTWQFVSHIAHGGEAIPDNGLTPVWEPFLMLYDGQLVCYCSDQRNWPAHGQKLVHQVSSDLLKWDPVVDDVAYNNNTFRPGMPVVSQLPLGNWIMTYEFYGAPQAAFAVYYRINNNPLEFDNSIGQPLIATDGTVPVSSPYNVWTPVGGDLGTIVVSCGTLSQVLLNWNMGAPGAWTKVATPEGISYTRNLRVLPEPSKILITGAGQLPPAPNNSVTTSEIDITPRLYNSD